MHIRSALSGVLFLLLASCCVGQEITATVLGTVTDSTGAVVAGATIIVMNADQGIVARRLTTSRSGDYVVPLLAIGHYNVSADAAGFKTTLETGIELSVNDRRAVNFVLQVHGLKDEIQVEAEPLQVDLQTAAAAGLISGTQVRELASNTRNYTQLVLLQPGVSSGLASDQPYVGTTSLSGGINEMAFSINGARDSQNNWTLDGADNVDRGSNHTLLTFPSIDSIAEFKVLRGNYDAEFGRGSGGQINVVTRSGTNTFHGGAYEFFRNEVFAANNFFNNLSGLARPPLRYNNFGFTLGGPVHIPHLRNTFFFYSQEWRRVINYTTFTSSRVPTPAELQGTFTTPVCTKPIIDPVTQLCVGPTTSQITDIDPTAVAYIMDIYSKLPAPGPDGTLRFTGRNLFNFREETFKIDHVFGPKLSAFFKYTHDTIPTEEPGGFGVGSSLPGVATTRTKAPGSNIVARATMFITPHLVNEVGYSYSHGAILSQPVGLASEALSPDINPNLPFKNLSGRVPALFFNAESLLALGSFRDLNTNHSTFDSLTWILGQHTTKYGVVYHHYEKDEGPFYRSDSGGYSFLDIGPTGNSFEQQWANFLLGNAQSFDQTNKNPRADILQNELELFAQDQYRIRSNLTLSYGLRWSFFRQPTEGQGHLTNFDPGAFDPAAAPVIDITTGAFVTGTPIPVMNGIIVGGQNSRFGNAVARQANRNVAPRFAFAWDPFSTGKTSLRGGYGIVYDVPPMGQFEGGTANNPPFVQHITIFNTNLSNPAGTAAAVNLYPQALSGVDVNWRQPYVQQWSIDVQRQVTRSMLFDIGYYANRALHLTAGVDINQPRPGAYLSAGVLPQGPITFKTEQLLNYVRPYRGFGPIDIASPRFQSNYHSLQAQWQWRAGENNLVTLNYTWSHALTDAPNQYTNPQNGYDLHAGYGPADFDRRHIFTGSYIYHLPFYRLQRGLTGHLLGGWEISGIVYAQSGLWLTVNGVNIDPAGLGLADLIGDSRPDQLANPNQHALHTVDQWFNGALFADPPADGIRPGNAPRGSVLGPGAWRWDASLFKNTNINERVTVQFRAEATNVLNHTNFDQIGTGFLFDPIHFGQVMSARDARIIQFGLKLAF
jgi:Carboxypeptidase regulatory-like domain/TonB-dependent Receptor Plug Domain